MQQGYRSLRDCVFHSPLGLSCLPSKTRQLANYYLPTQTGIEIECNDVHSFIPNRKFSDLKLVDMSFSECEQRFRIKEGEEGMIQLYGICQVLREHYALNPLSGIHYHTSAPFIHYSSAETIINENETHGTYEWVLNQLDGWGYTGRYNRRQLSVTKGSWVTLRPDMGTIEYRIGEMSFSYDVLIRRIIHCHSITKRIKEMINPQDRPAPAKRSRKTLANVLGYRY